MDLDQIRQKRMKELQANQEEQEKLKQEVEVLEKNAKNYLEKDAIVRLGSLKSAFPEKSAQVAAILTQLVQQGQLNKRLSDDEFKNLLKDLTPKKKEIKITRK
jgi:programmed cell death protein 5